MDNKQIHVVADNVTNVANKLNEEIDLIEKKLMHRILEVLSAKKVEGNIEELSSALLAFEGSLNLAKKMAS